MGSKYVGERLEIWPATQVFRQLLSDCGAQLFVGVWQCTVIARLLETGEAEHQQEDSQATRVLEIRDTHWWMAAPSSQVLNEVGQ